LNLKRLLLQIQAALAPLDAAHQVGDADPQRRFDAVFPIGSGLCFGGSRQDFGQVRAQATRELAQVLPGQWLVFQVGLDDARWKARERELARAQHAGTIDPSEQLLIAQALDGVGRSPPHRLRARFDQRAHLLEHLAQLVLIERGKPGALRLQVQRREEAQIQRP
jgi:hypothetical protein